MKNRIIITGATGFIGSNLCRQLTKAEYQVIALSRNPNRASKILGPNVQTVLWDAKNPEPCSEHADNAFAIINLAGENIASSRWSREKKQRSSNPASTPPAPYYRLSGKQKTNPKSSSRLPQ